MLLEPHTRATILFASILDLMRIPEHFVTLSRLPAPKVFREIVTMTSSAAVLKRRARLREWANIPFLQHDHLHPTRCRRR
jgi:hypothetical protein